MPVNITPGSGLGFQRQADASHTGTASVSHQAEAGAVVKTSSNGSTQVTADLTGISGGGRVQSAEPADVLARLAAGHTVSSASDTKAFTVKADARLDLAVTAKAHAEVFASVQGGELKNAGNTAITGAPTEAKPQQPSVNTAALTDQRATQAK